MLTSDLDPEQDPDAATTPGFEQSLSSDLFEVRRSLARLCDFLKALSLSLGEVERIELVAAEALNNTVEHGYDFQKGMPIWLSCTVDPRRVVLRISDRGRAIPPVLLLHHPMPSPADYQEVLREGGWGWALIHHLCQKLSYHRDQDINHLLLEIGRGADLPPDP